MLSLYPFFRVCRRQFHQGPVVVNRISYLNMHRLEGGLPLLSGSDVFEMDHASSNHIL